MKVNQHNAEWQPIVITLESKEEAWHLHDFLYWAVKGSDAHGEAASNLLELLDEVLG